MYFVYVSKNQNGFDLVFLKKSNLLVIYLEFVKWIQFLNLCIAS